MDRFSSRTRPSEIRALTGLRGVAASFVVLYHLGGHHLGHGAVHQFIEHGYLCVDLFFSLSGFVLALTYAKYFTNGLTVSSVRKYIIDRIARIFPLFWFVTLYEFMREQTAPLSALVGHSAVLALPLAPNWFALITNLLLIQTWGLGDSIVGPGWSLSTEWAVSLIFPLLALLVMVRRSRGAWLALLVSILSLAWLGMMPSSITGASGIRGPMDMTTGTSYAPVLRCFADFTLGMVALRIASNKRIQHVAARNEASLCIATAILGLLCIPASDLVIILLFPMFIVTMSFGTPFLVRILGSAPLHHVGKISYSLYLIHILLIPYDFKIIHVLTRLRVPAVTEVGLVLSITMAIGVATISYRLIEVPGRLILRRWFGRWRSVSPINPMLTPP